MTIIITIVAVAVLIAFGALLAKAMIESIGWLGFLSVVGTSVAVTAAVVWLNYIIKAS